jgi:predicted metal-dependent hydrolase
MKEILIPIPENRFEEIKVLLMEKEVEVVENKKESYLKAMDFVIKYRNEINTEVMKDAILSVIIPMGDIFSEDEEFILTLNVEDYDGIYISGVSFEDVKQRDEIEEFYDSELESIFEQNWERLYYQNLKQYNTFTLTKKELMKPKEE